MYNDEIIELLEDVLKRFNQTLNTVELPEFSLIMNRYQLFDGKEYSVTAVIGMVASVERDFSVFWKLLENIFISPQGHEKISGVQIQERNMGTREKDKKILIGKFFFTDPDFPYTQFVYNQIVSQLSERLSLLKDECELKESFIRDYGFPGFVWPIGSLKSVCDESKDLGS